MVGKELDGRYRIIEKIGEGGMGVVYKAEQLLLKRVVALKVLRRETVQDQAAVKRFLNEAQAIAGLDSPHTVTLHDFSMSQDGQLYYTMELLKGRPLSRLIRKEAPLSVGRAANLILQVCDSLEEAHEKGILHRDLKPDNLFVVDRRGQEEIKVLDFGVAKLLGKPSSESVTIAGIILGTPQYLSPEQALGHTLTPASDLYSLGIVFYEMLAGAPPFVGSTPLETMWAHVREAVPSVSARSPGAQVPRCIEEFLFQALEKDPGKRFQSVQAFREALQEALAGSSEDEEVVDLPALESSREGVRLKTRQWEPPPALVREMEQLERLVTTTAQREAVRAALPDALDTERNAAGPPGAEEQLTPQRRHLPSQEEQLPQGEQLRSHGEQPHPQRESDAPTTSAAMRAIGRCRGRAPLWTAMALVLLLIGGLSVFLKYGSTDDGAVTAPPISGGAQERVRSNASIPSEEAPEPKPITGLPAFPPVRRADAATDAPASKADPISGGVSLPKGLSQPVIEKASSYAGRGQADGRASPVRDGSGQGEEPDVSSAALGAVAASEGCGNGSCEIGESCSTCNEDCGTCSVGWTWVHVKGGRFTMGCTGQDIDCAQQERPARPVDVAHFQLMSTEVTEDQFRALMGANPSCNSRSSGAASGSVAGSLPVECVTWAQAEEFCAKAGGRLPTEAEWEYAARSGGAFNFACGDGFDCLDASAWYSANAGGAKHPVGAKTASALGLFDLSGNVAEWVADEWHPDYTGAPATGYPAWNESGSGEHMVRRESGQDPERRGSGQHPERRGSGEHLARGGSFYDVPVYLRTTKRVGSMPADAREPSIGFRCAYGGE